MKWNISSVEGDLNELVIIGFSAEDSNTCFRSTITLTSLDQEKDNYFGDYSEHCAISVVNPNQVYRIEVGFYNDHGLNLQLNGQPYDSADRKKYLNSPVYMGLPFIVFAQWKGMLTTDI